MINGEIVSNFSLDSLAFVENGELLKFKQHHYRLKKWKSYVWLGKWRYQ
jgi:hypothetical protein